MTMCALPTRAATPGTRAPTGRTADRMWPGGAPRRPTAAAMERSAIFVRRPVTTALAAIGLAGMLEAMFDLCLAAALVGCPVDGSAIRKKASLTLQVTWS